MELVHRVGGTYVRRDNVLRGGDLLCDPCFKKDDSKSGMAKSQDCMALLLDKLYICYTQKSVVVDRYVCNGKNNFL